MNVYFKIACGFLLSIVVVFFGFAQSELDEIKSVCYGTTAKGRLENGIALPDSGKNFVSYGTLPQILGRTYVHNKVRDVVLESYRMLEKVQPGKIFKYAETGFKEGGAFKPHKTHQNGLSVDFMVPVLNAKGDSVHLPTHAFNKYGYEIEFDDKGQFDEYRIDYEALGAHMMTLHQAANSQGIKIWRILFDPVLQPFLYASKYGTYIRDNISIPKKRSWVRHDEHYHVDFILKCKPL